MVKNNFSYEEVYAVKVMAFEKDMVSKNRRPPLPVRRRYVNMAPAADAQRKEAAKVRQEMYRAILANIPDGEATNVQSLANKMGIKSQQLTNYMKPMVEEGYLARLKMAGGMVYVYLRTGKELPE